MQKAKHRRKGCEVSDGRRRRRNPPFDANFLLHRYPPLLRCKINVADVSLSFPPLSASTTLSNVVVMDGRKSSPAFKRFFKFR